MRSKDERVSHFHEYNIDTSTRTIYFGDTENGIDDTVAEKTIKNLILLDTINQEPINIVMNSQGGDCYAALAIYDAIKMCKSRVIVTGFGSVMSAATLIMQAADERVLAPNSTFMIHIGTVEYGENHAKNVRNWIKAEEKMDAIISNIYLARIQEKHENFTLKKLDKLMEFDTILNATDAIAMGLADSLLY